MSKHEAFVKKLCTILVAQKKCSEREAFDLEKSFQDSDQDQFDDFLLEEDLISSADLLEALAEYYQVDAFDVVGHFFDRHDLIKFPKEFLLIEGIIPLEDDESTLVMIASDPADPQLLAKIGTYVSYDIQFRVGLRRDICDAVKEFYNKSLSEEGVQTIYDDPELPADIVHEEHEEAEKLDEEFVHDSEQEEL